MSVYTWSKENLFLERNKLIQKQEGHCAKKFSQDAGCGACGLGENSKCTTDNTPTAPSHCTTLPSITQPRDNWHQTEVCQRGDQTKNTVSLLHSHCSIPKIKYSRNKRSHLFVLAAVQSEGKCNAQHRTWSDRWPATMSQVPQVLPAQTLKSSTCHPKLVVLWLSCSMDALSKLCQMVCSQKHWFMTTTLLPNRWTRIQRRISSSKTRCRNLQSYWLWSQAITDHPSRETASLQR